MGILFADATTEREELTNGKEQSLHLILAAGTR
jgi:hypothetical protein